MLLWGVCRLLGAGPFCSAAPSMDHGPPSTLPPAPLPGCRDQLAPQDAIWILTGAGVKAGGVSPHPSKPPRGLGMSSNNPGQSKPSAAWGGLRGAAWPGQVGEQTSLYSVKYLFLHYFTRVVFTETLQKFPKKHRHAKKKKKKIKNPPWILLQVIEMYK